MHYICKVQHASRQSTTGSPFHCRHPFEIHTSVSTVSPQNLSTTRLFFLLPDAQLSGDSNTGGLFLSALRPARKAPKVARIRFLLTMSREKIALRSKL